ncbi:hypothetical protein [Saccharolobus caldissimus]|uniref:Uncharacterized protein n=1 Tax=Saccharolobus caldissimus TaxID=1702097 RepID=A0AAQ4CUE7_9CREN|nr:hypothetical protein [Saccharolobus caldissimus]BDB99428.1 hypothetical protein SACC_24450 [Saccharolobus caldissimus]
MLEAIEIPEMSELQLRLLDHISSIEAIGCDVGVICGVGTT